MRVIQGAGRFLDKRTVAAGDYRISARRFVIATGSSPLVPPIPGLDTVPFFTNETIFDNERKLDHLIVIGGGPIGMEMAQAHTRLGSSVTVLEADKALPKDDPELSAVVLKHLRAEGIDIREGTKVERVESLPGYLRVHVSIGDRMDVVEGTHLLVAAGRRPNVGDLNLEAGRVKYDKRGITVDRGLRTSNSRVFAIGDVTGGLQFTHIANYHAGIVIRRALFKLPAKVNTAIVPWVTYTEPELAHVGLTEQQAEKQTDRHQRPAVALPRERSRPGRAGDGGPHQGADRQEGAHSRRDDRGPACRRAHPDVVARHLAGLEDQGDDRLDLALSDARRDQQARRLPLLCDSGGEPVRARRDRLSRPVWLTPNLIGPINVPYLLDI